MFKALKTKLDQKKNDEFEIALWNKAAGLPEYKPNLEPKSTERSSLKKILGDTMKFYAPIEPSKFSKFMKKCKIWVEKRVLDYASWHRFHFPGPHGWSELAGLGSTSFSSRQRRKMISSSSDDLLSRLNSADKILSLYGNELGDLIQTGMGGKRAFINNETHKE